MRAGTPACTAQGDKALDDATTVSYHLRKITRPIIFLLAGVMFLLIFSQVVLRYGFLRPLAWSEEASRYLMIWIICLAASEAYGKGQHVGVSLLQKSLPAVRTALPV